MDCKLGEEGFSLFIRDSWMNNNVVTLLPVDWRRDTMLVSKL